MTIYALACGHWYRSVEIRGEEAWCDGCREWMPLVVDDEDAAYEGTDCDLGHNAAGQYHTHECVIPEVER